MHVRIQFRAKVVKLFWWNYWVRYTVTRPSFNAEGPQSEGDAAARVRGQDEGEAEGKGAGGSELVDTPP